MTTATTRPAPRRPRPRTYVWMDWQTGHGQQVDGTLIRPIQQDRRRKTIRLIDILETAWHHSAQVVVLCDGNDIPVPTDPTEWLLEETPGWDNDGHWLSDNGTGRFRRADDPDYKLTVVTPRDWFPSSPVTLNVPKARQLHLDLQAIVSTAIKRDWPLMQLPGQTGLNIFKLVATKSWAMEPINRDIGRLIQATEPQHRIDHYVGGRKNCDCCVPLIPAGAELPGLAYADGRFMYLGAIQSSVGAAPAERLTAVEAADLFTESKGYHPARYKVRFTPSDIGIPMPGLLPWQAPDGTWHWPNRPGTTWESWADSREILLAREMDYQIEFLEGIKFTKTDSLRPLRKIFEEMLQLCDTYRSGGEPLTQLRKELLSSAIKHMFRVTIGAMSRRPRLVTHVADSREQIPEAAHESIRRGDKWIYHLPNQVSDDDRADDPTWHPEIAALLWGLARVRVLDTPTAPIQQGKRIIKKAGLLTVPFDQLVGVQGDAIYTTHIQPWTLPTGHPGGGDDGAFGRIRLKGYLPGPIEAPADRLTRQVLSNKAEERGWLPTDLELEF